MGRKTSTCQHPEGGSLSMSTHRKEEAKEMGLTDVRSPSCKEWPSPVGRTYTCSTDTRTVGVVMVSLSVWEQKVEGVV